MLFGFQNGNKATGMADLIYLAKLLREDQELHPNY
jgi:hypothetical protein